MHRSLFPLLTSVSLFLSPDLQRQAWLKSLSSEELQAVREYAWDQLLKGHKVVVDGKVHIAAADSFASMYSF